MIEIPCFCGNRLAPKELNDISPDQLREILKKGPIEIICNECDEIFVVGAKTKIYKKTEDECLKAYA